MTKGIVTVEEGLVGGGLGGVVSELVCREHPTRVRSIGVPDTFAPTGKPDFLFEEFGLTAENTARVAREIAG